MIPWSMLLLMGMLAAALTAPAHAQREVYDPEPPRGSAYLRFVNALPGSLELRPDFLPAQRLGADPAQRVGAYMVVENVSQRPLALEAREGSRVQRVALRALPDSFLTVLVHAGADGGIIVTPLPEEMNFNRARARLGFYNAVAGCPTGGLRLDPAGPVVFQDVVTATGQQRTVNPVQAQVRAICGERMSTVFALQGLEAGASYSVWLMPGTGQELQGFLSRDVTTPWRR